MYFFSVPQSTPKAQTVKIRKSSGSGQGSCTEVERYDPLSEAWELSASMHRRRRNFAAAAVGGAVYVVGGVRPLFCRKGCLPPAPGQPARAYRSCAPIKTDGASEEEIAYHMHLIVAKLQITMSSS